MFLRKQRINEKLKPPLPTYPHPLDLHNSRIPSVSTVGIGKMKQRQQGHKVLIDFSKTIAVHMGGSSFTMSRLTSLEKFEVAGKNKHLLQVLSPY